MLSESFVLLPSVGLRTEKKFWHQGLNSWDAFLQQSSIRGIGSARKERFDWFLKEAKTNLKNDNSQFFAETLAFSEQWRLYDQFKEDACFLDIETSGYYGDITVIGISDGTDCKTFVRGFNLDKYNVERELKKYKLVITFNGASFDLPVIRRYFNLPISMPHIDLRFAAQKIGYSGGLKAIERKLNIKRREEVEDMAGEDAVYLWEQWRATGNRDYLDKLVWYNEEDCINLKPLAKIVIPKLWEKTRLID